MFVNVRWEALAGLALALCAASLPVRADEATPSTQQLIERLRPGALPSGSVEFRGIVVHRPVSSDPARAGPPNVDLAVNFAFGSARLTADDELLLDNLGRALKDPALAGSRFAVDGHTDAVGTAAYNQRLSEQRAAAVRQYLIRRFAVEGDRLEAHGYGFTRLLDPSDPKSAVNRRVEIINIGSPP